MSPIRQAEGWPPVIVRSHMRRRLTAVFENIRSCLSRRFFLATLARSLNDFVNFFSINFHNILLIKERMYGVYHRSYSNFVQV